MTSTSKPCRSDDGWSWSEWLYVETRFRSSPSLLACPPGKGPRLSGSHASGLIQSAIPKSSEAVQALMMRAGITVKVTADDRRRLEAIVSDRNAPQKHVWRAKIILATADGCGTSEIMRRSGKAK
ncbi:MAG TPA: hypothetical protein VFJ90_09180, partial [Candidatus Didemnitutus sp.]|nr:hypothetical protein [Candidatus Didemnitutus sp.]